jgi:hypothetical protein
VWAIVHESPLHGDASEVAKYGSGVGDRQHCPARESQAMTSRASLQGGTGDELLLPGLVQHVEHLIRLNHFHGCRSAALQLIQALSYHCYLRHNPAPPSWRYEFSLTVGAQTHERACAPAVTHASWKLGTSRSWKTFTLNTS